MGAVEVEKDKTPPVPSIACNGPVPQPQLNHFGPATQFNADVFERIMLDIESGCSVKKAAIKHGIAHPTLYAWVDNFGLSDRFTQAKLTLGHDRFNRVFGIVQQLACFEKWKGDAKDKQVRVKALDLQSRLELELAKRLNRAEYGDKVETLNTNINMSYVVSLGPESQAYAPAPQVVDVVSVQDGSGVESVNKGSKLTKPKASKSGPKGSGRKAGKPKGVSVEKNS